MHYTRSSFAATDNIKGLTPACYRLCIAAGAGPEFRVEKLPGCAMLNSTERGSIFAEVRLTNMIRRRDAVERFAPASQSTQTCHERRVPLIPPANVSPVKHGFAKRVGAPKQSPGSIAPVSWTSCEGSVDRTLNSAEKATQVKGGKTAARLGSIGPWILVTQLQKWERVVAGYSEGRRPLSERALLRLPPSSWRP